MMKAVQQQSLPNMTFSRPGEEPDLAGDVDCLWRLTYTLDGDIRTAASGKIVQPELFVGRVGVAAALGWDERLTSR